MSFYFRIVIVFILISKSYAMDIYGVYLSSCERKLGLILNVDTTSLRVLTINGVVEEFPRYEITTIASYPLETFPSNRISIPKINKVISIKTRFKGRLIPIVKGWPIKYSKSKISFLTTTGKEVPISRDSIWAIDEETSNVNFSFSNKLQTYEFLHPTTLNSCPRSIHGEMSDKAFEIAPQSFESDPVVIKKNMDKIIEEQKRIVMYLRSKNFYSIPQVYNNKTTLGLWLSGNSRHGASANRPNNWAPILENQFSSGPYGYQHVFYTGARQNKYFVHEEPQSQVFYRFKADYFHFSYFLDPSVVLMGDKYRWFPDELSVEDYRVNDVNFAEFGFDYKSFSILYQPQSEVQVGYKNKNMYFFDGALNLPRYGFEFKFLNWGIDFLMGSTAENIMSDKKYDVNGNEIGFAVLPFTFSTKRINIEYDFNEVWQYGVSYIQRSFTSSTNQFDTGTLYFLSSYRYSYKYLFKAYSSIESIKSSNFHERSNFFKIGFNSNLIF